MMDKNKMRDTMEKLLEEHILHMKNLNVNEEKLREIRNTVQDFIASKQVELYTCLFQRKIWCWYEKGRTNVTVNIDVNWRVSFWQALKLRIAGKNMEKLVEDTIKEIKKSTRRNV